MLLTLLDSLNGSVGHTDFQKLLLLFTHECETEPSYEFVPYRFGGFSFTSYADKRKLIKKGFLEEDEHKWRLTDEGRHMAKKQTVDPLRMVAFRRKYSKCRGNALIIEQYRRYPYYANRSELLNKLPLDADDLAGIVASKPKSQTPGLLTIGYEGRSLESYLNELLRASVTVLCDVRSNPLSRKYGFSKKSLKHACEGVGLRYEHLPELGIPSALRRDLVTQADYDELFLEYERTALPKQVNILSKILEWMSAGDRVALTCYEKLPEQCHRHCVADAVEQMDGVERGTRHL